MYIWFLFFIDHESFLFDLIFMVDSRQLKQGGRESDFSRHLLCGGLLPFDKSSFILLPSDKSSFILLPSDKSRVCTVAFGSLMEKHLYS